MHIMGPEVITSFSGLKNYHATPFHAAALFEVQDLIRRSPKLAFKQMDQSRKSLTALNNLGPLSIALGTIPVVW